MSSASQSLHESAICLRLALELLAGAGRDDVPVAEILLRGVSLLMQQGELELDYPAVATALHSLARAVLTDELDPALLRRTQLTVEREGGGTSLRVLGWMV